MTVLTRYLARFFFSLLAVILPGLAGLYLLVEVFERVDDFIEARVPAQVTLAYFLLRTPEILSQLAPMAVLLSGLLTVAVLSRHSEILALRALGVAPGRVVRPFLLAAALVGAVFLAAEVFVVPQAAMRAQRIYQEEVSRTPLLGIWLKGRLYYHGEGCIWTLMVENWDASRLRDVRILCFDPGYRMREYLAARRAVYREGAWHFLDGQDKVMTPGGLEVRPFKEMVRRLPETPETFIAVRAAPSAMTPAELWTTLRRLQEAGQPAAEVATALAAALLYPFLGLSLLAMALPLILAQDRGHLGVGLGLGLLFGFGAWVLWSAALILGRTGVLPPALAPLLVHALLWGAGWGLVKRLRF
ncbi:LptF/LptG family permease [Dissulfurirhabdus thermomarina]|uniref:LptF/LptG family permease n=1 Tax=Dissulfurirhabdus thermomarina TaxID=1765737 RepID=A0A6N9TWR4_DISTH|nr:LptF/LptG family permease [Dissulfurirhabdus thermomarina]NDY42926.1 LptF/LptG family permease [Dissulfurirhabdus thermomarina]NMX23419.1 LptF/LptG family permease [Dissulfurirhabdus thermomarina]